MEIHVDKTNVSVRMNGETLYSNTMEKTLNCIKNIDAILLHYLEEKCLWLETLHDTKMLNGDEKIAAEQRCYHEINRAARQIAVYRALLEQKNAIIVAHLTRF
jgi:hypothetical protein